MNDPLTKSQRELRGRDLRVLSVDQLRDWTEACTKMENCVGFKKARRSWRRSRDEANEELVRRGVDVGDD